MSSSLERRLAAIRDRFARQLPERVEGLVASIEALRAGTLAPDGLAELIRTAHSLAGSAPTMGFGPLGTAARALELFLEPVAARAGEAPAVIDAAESSELGRFVAALEMPDAPTDLGVVPVASGDDVVTRLAPVRDTTLAEDGVTEAAGGPVPVVVIDDDPDFAESLSLSLASAGFDASFATTGESGIARVEEVGARVVLLDLVMPGMDGLEVCRRLRASKGARDAVIVFLTSTTDEETVLRAYDLGAEDYLAKPPSLPLLAGKLRALLAQRPSRRPVGSEAKPGDIIDGRHRVVRELDRGGMGVVYLVELIDGGEQLALKMLSLTSAPTAAERFEQEVRTLASIDHPSIVRVRESGHADGVAYYTMDYLSGGSLERRLEDLGPRPPSEVLATAAKLADGLAAAHALGILHRDVKPENILYDASGEPVLTDFGVVLDRRATRRLTTTTRPIGTLAYMSPEQLGQPDTVDARSDVYSLGVVLWKMLVGRLPFLGLSAAELAVRMMTDDVPPVAEAAPDVPAEPARVVDRAVAHRRDDRWPSAGALAVAAREALARLEGGSG